MDSRFSYQLFIWRATKIKVGLSHKLSKIPNQGLTDYINGKIALTNLTEAAAFPASFIGTFTMDRCFKVSAFDETTRISADREDFVKNTC